MQRVLVISADSPAIDLPRVLTAGGYEVTAERLSDLPLSDRTGGRPDLMVADMRRVDLDLRSLLRSLGDSAPPVLAAIHEHSLDAEALEFAGDIVVEPFSDAELLTRVRLALLRATGELSADTIKRGDLLIDVGNYRVLLNQQPVDLTYKEYELLKFLATNDGKVFTREALLNRVWGYNYYGGARTVDVHIRRIRSKIEAGGHAYIETVRNVGYRFSAR
ncbi:MAG TPA: response regulator transcription factor [Dehalococcoidia bacterium]|nr:response regulator transcription factor [Dehalococcoidia bacterium]HEX5939204.1 response regulator transcription factor [Dehalococcoidia bacterium]